ncbi:tail fiber protein [Roseococcus pinisoli]|uniref:Tail fiber protein n=1 Tax=Roseococcus pinisoli TaxID=2835040 RepID=A0ABS5QAK7_9PROT|nr:tail fiber protein [Roseococcus pinisoli]MBS7810542.1 tail fiber protein [Roseococcus pinisoli]
MLADRVMCAVPNPGVVDVGRTITLGAAPNGFRRFLTAFGGAKPAYFVLSDGAERTITGVWTVNATTPETATITRIIGNDRTGDTSGETFGGDCVAWNEVPAAEVVAFAAFQRLQDMFIGMSLEWNGAALPPGFLWENGANHSRTTYAKLFAAIGTTHGAGDGTTTFAVPDSRGLVAIGRDNMGGAATGRMTMIPGTTLGAKGGSEWLHAHNHAVNDPGHTHLTRTRTQLLGSAPPGGGQPLWNGDDTYYINAALTGVSVVTNGAGNSQNVQPGIIKNKIIFTGVFP